MLLSTLAVTEACRSIGDAAQHESRTPQRAGRATAGRRQRGRCRRPSRRADEANDVGGGARTSRRRRGRRVARSTVSADRRPSTGGADEFIAAVSRRRVDGRARARARCIPLGRRPASGTLAPLPPPSSRHTALPAARACRLRHRRRGELTVHARPDDGPRVGRRNGADRSRRCAAIHHPAARHWWLRYLLVLTMIVGIGAVVATEYAIGPRRDRRGTAGDRLRT